MKKNLNYNKIVNAILLVALIILINIFSLNVFTRLDLTDNNIFSLSDASKNILKKIDDRVTIKAYFTKNLPAPYSSVSRYVKDILEEYEAYGRGKIYFEFINPGDDKKLEKEALEFRVPPVQINALENDKLEIKKVYMGLVFLYHDKKEVLPVISKTAGLEYDITSTIKKLIEKNKKKIGIIQGHGEPDFNNQLSTLTAVFNKQYDVKPINLPNVNSIEADAILWISPSDTISKSDLYKIDQFIMKGGKVGLFLNNYDVKLEKGIAFPKRLNISNFLENYGIKINNDMVMDLQCAPVSVSQRQGFFQIVNQINYPYFPIITDFNKDEILVKDLERTVHFFPSSIDTAFAGKIGIKFLYLEKTSDKSKLELRPYNVSPLQKFLPATFNKKGLIISGIYTGKFKSFFQKDSIPSEFDKNLYLGESDTNRIIVFTEGRFLQDDYLASARENLILASNIVDWLSQDEDLIAIRSKQVTARPLHAPESNVTRNIIKWLNILIPPVLMIILGFVISVWRKSNRNKTIALIINKTEG